MQYVRGIPSDFNLWATQFGAKNWTYDHVLKYFIKAENNTDGEIVSRSRTSHGTAGPMKLSSTQFKDDPIALDMLRAAKSLGFEILPELNSPPYFEDREMNSSKIHGRMAYLQTTSYKGRRCSTSWAYLEENKQHLRPNLHVLANSQVVKILFDENKKATGVEFFKNGQKHQVNATKEIIISAGAIESPKLLMLSGLGPKNHLESKKVKVLADLPVGQNLMTHVLYGNLLIKNKRPVEPLWTLENLYSLYQNGSGLLSKFGGFFPYSQIKSQYSDQPETVIYLGGELLIYMNLHPRSRGKIFETKIYFLKF